ncbi:MAG TPA: hypothetical protein VF421_11065 [Niabella sp.]
MLVENDEPIRAVFQLLFEEEYQLIMFETGIPVINREIDLSDLFVLKAVG